MKKIINISVFFAIVLFFSFLYSMSNDWYDSHQAITGYAVSSDGCCERFCEETTALECYEGEFYYESCDEIEECNIGCCIDNEGYCLSNYLKSNCEKSGYSFFKKECSELIQCVKPPSVYSVRQGTGIHLNDDDMVLAFYGLMVQGVSLEDDTIVWDPDEPYGARIPFVFPLSGRAGDTFVINYLIADSQDVSGVNTVLRDDNYQIDSIELFDDGMHSDGNVGDGMFGAAWTSPSMSDGMHQIVLDIEISDQDSIFSDDNVINFTVVSGIDCMPFFSWIRPEERRDIIFLGNKYSMGDSVDRIIQDAANNVGNMMITSPFVDNLHKLNFYVIAENHNVNSPVAITRSIMSDCSFFNPEQDIAIIMDYNEPSCRKIDDGIFATSPETIYYYDNGLGLEQALADMCGVFTTMGDYIYTSATPPNARFLTEWGKTFWQKDQKIEYKLTDPVDEFIRYGIYLNDELEPFFEGYARDGIVEKKILQFPDGHYRLSIEAVNSRGNKGYSLPPLQFDVDTSFDYEIYVTEPADGAIVNEANIEFLITHNAVENVTYELYLDDTLIKSELVNIGETILVLIEDLSEGEHSFFILAIDGEGREIESEERIFSIETGI